MIIEIFLVPLLGIDQTARRVLRGTVAWEEASCHFEGKVALISEDES